MKIHYLQHAPFEGPAYLECIARLHGGELAGTRLFAGEALPERSDCDLLAVMGGPMGVHDEKQHPWLADEKRFIEAMVHEGKRIVGICLGAQLIASVLGAPVYKNAFREIGWFPVRRCEEVTGSGGIGRVFPEQFNAFHWHGDTFGIPRGAIRIGESEACRNQGFIYDDRVMGLQFHLEATPDSVRALVENCRDDLDGSRFVQSEEEIAADSYFMDCNRLFVRLLSDWLL